MEPEQHCIDQDLVQKILQASRDLKTKGYAVVRQVLSKDEASQTLADMWDCLEKATDHKITRNADFAKMKATDLLPHQHGIIHSYRFNHAPPCRRIRRNKRLLQIYAALYGTDQLTASMDRINFKVPGRRFKSKAAWPHVDQDPRLVDRVTIQGLVTLTDAMDEADPGNRLYEGSHLVFEEFFAKRRRGGKVNHWVTLEQNEAAKLQLRCPLVKPSLEAGDLLLWDSRTVHSPWDGTNFDKGRFVVYVCYNKVWGEKVDDAQYWEDKREAFTACRATRHTPLNATVKESLFPELPRSYVISQPPAYSEFTQEQQGIPSETL